MSTRLPVRPGPTARANPSRVLALGAVAGPVLFTLAWLVLGFVSPGYTVAGTHIAPYSLVSQPISGLGMGDTAPFMNTAFVLSGLLLLAGVIGVFQGTAGTGRPAARWVSTVLLALSPAGLVVVGLFDLDSPLPHFAGAALIYILPILSFPLAGRYLRGIPRWRRFGNGLLIAGALTLVLTLIFLMTFDEDTTAAGHGIGGLTQRILFTEVLAWFAAMGWWARRQQEA
ncbi:DUF998 domain-containing protein [Micromonospora sp. C28SCA-DRY-2]|uniref:DUF998 domain-containing protein n=1 Tax=Micromonospora sp. C28SCA-DRY-2 TaxID=3059522 RepID=UPI0026750B74|nr:DUF998 domain-containing protein [Micromonospora sp. C28SCA-DRY-2]MDO3700271.1 DUF998 domain-containing protein [Micromonospora sp. C28SCA-DRY-2]